MLRGYAGDRLIRLPAVDPRLAVHVPNGVESERRRFHYDTAQASPELGLEVWSGSVEGRKGSQSSACRHGRSSSAWRSGASRLPGAPAVRAS